MTLKLTLKCHKAINKSNFFSISIIFLKKKLKETINLVTLSFDLLYIMELDFLVAEDYYYYYYYYFLLFAVVENIFETTVVVMYPMIELL